MTDLPLKWGGTAEIDWSDTELFDFSVSDVTEALGGARFRWGASERSNPERPIVDYGRGGLRLVGERYSLGLSNVLTDDQLQRRHRIRITPPGQAPIEGWCAFDHRRPSADRSSRFLLEGLRVADLSADLDISQPTSGLATSTMQFVDWVGQHLGLTVPVEVRAAARTLDTFDFSGRRGELLSRLAQVLTSLPCAGRAGTLRIHDPTRPPPNLNRLDSATLAIVDARSKLDRAHIRNEISEVVNVPVVPGTTTVHTITETLQIDAPASLVAAGELVGMVQLVGEGTISNVSVTLDSLERLVPDYFVTADLDGTRNYSRVVSFAWQNQNLSSGGQSSSAAVSESNRLATVTVDVRGNIVNTGSYTFRYSNFGSVSFPSTTPAGWAQIPASDAQLGGEDAPVIDRSPFGTSAINRVFGLRATVTVSYTLTTPSSGGDVLVTVRNQPSIEAWGPKPLPFPVWLLYTDVAEATAALQPIVNALGEPRRLHTIEFALPQVNDAGNAALSVEPGDYRRVTVNDVRLPTTIDAICMILACELLVDVQQRGRMRLVCIESGGHHGGGAYSDAYDDAYD